MATKRKTPLKKKFIKKTISDLAHKAHSSGTFNGFAMKISRFSIG